MLLERKINLAGWPRVFEDWMCLTFPRELGKAGLFCSTEASQEQSENGLLGKEAKN